MSHCVAITTILPCLAVLQLLLCFNLRWAAILFCRTMLQCMGSSFRSVAITALSSCRNVLQLLSCRWCNPPCPYCVRVTGALYALYAHNMRPWARTIQVSVGAITIVLQVLEASCLIVLQSRKETPGGFWWWTYDVAWLYLTQLCKRYSAAAAYKNTNEHGQIHLHTYTHTHTADFDIF